MDEVRIVEQLALEKAQLSNMAQQMSAVLAALVDKAGGKVELKQTELELGGTVRIEHVRSRKVVRLTLEREVDDGV